MQDERPQSVVVFVSSLSAGGTERAAVRVAGWLCEAGHEVTLLTMASADRDFFATPAGVRRVALDMLNPSRGVYDALRSNWRRLVAIRRAVVASRADTVIALADQVNIVMLLALIGIRCRKIISERSDPATEKRALAWRMLRALTYPMADLHVAQSNHVKQWMRDKFPSLPNVVIGNTAGALPDGFDPTLRPDRREGELVQIVTLARLTREKGIDILLDAHARALHQGARIALTIVGDGIERSALEAQAQALGIASSVTFAGHREDVFAALAEADMFVLASRLEGFPNAVVEAMAAGLPVIAARCPGGTADVLGDEPERFALEFPPGDAAALAAAIVRLAAAPGLRQSIAAVSRERAKLYTADSIAAAWRAVVAPITGPPS